MFEMAREGRTRRRNTVLGLVIVVHALLVALALRHQETRHVAHENDASLIFLASAAPLPPPSAALPTQSNEAPSAAATSKRTERSAGDFSISLDAQTTPLSRELPLRLGANWDI